MYKFLNIANIHALDVCGKDILICNNKIFSFAFFPFIPFATLHFFIPVTSSNLRNQAPLFTDLCLVQGTSCFFLNFQGLRKTRPRVEPLTYQHRSFLKYIPYASGTNNCLLNQSLRWCYKQSLSTGIPMLDAGGTNTQLLYKSTPYHILGTSSCFLKPSPTLVSGGTNSCFINQLPMLEVRRVAFEINYSLRWWYISTLEVQPYGVGTDAADPYSFVV